MELSTQHQNCSLMEHATLALMANQSEPHMDSNLISAPCRPPSLMDTNTALMAINHSSLMDTSHHGAHMAPGAEAPGHHSSSLRRKRIRENDTEILTAPEETMDVVTLEYTGRTMVFDQRHRAVTDNSTKTKPMPHWLSEMPKKSRGDAALDLSLIHI
jgi:hypothetical protein